MGRRPLLAAIAVVVALAITASCTVRTSEGSRQTSPSYSSTSESPTQERSAQPVGSTPVLKGYTRVGEAPEDLAASDGVLWVAGQTDIQKQGCRKGAGNHCNNGVVRWWLVEVDERSGNIVRRVSIANGASTMAVGYGALWASSWDSHSSPPGVALLEVPNEGKRRPKLPPGLEGPVAVGGGSIWAESGANTPQAAIVRIDPTTRHVIASVGLPFGPEDLSFAGGFLWAFTRLQGVDRVYRIDAATNQIILNVRIPFHGRAYSVVADTTGAWVSLYGPGLVHISPDGTFEKPVVQGGIAAFAYAGGRAWSLGPPGTLYELNPRTGRIDRLVTGKEANKGFDPWSAALDPSTSMIWVSNYRNSITQVRLKRP